MHPWSAADISSIILRSQHAGVSLSPPNTPTPASATSSAPAFRAVNPATRNPTAQLQHPAAIARSQLRPIANTFARDSSHLHAFPQTAVYRNQDQNVISTSPHGLGRQLSLPRHISAGRAQGFQNTEDLSTSFASGILKEFNSSSSSHTEHSAHSLSASTLRHAPAVENNIATADDAAEAAQEREVLHSLRKQAISNEVELLRQRLAIVHLELHNRNKDYELLQRAAAVSAYRAEVAEHALTSLQQQVAASAAVKSNQLQIDASSSTSEDFAQSPLKKYCCSNCKEVSTQTLAASQVDSSGFSLLQRLVAVPSLSSPAGPTVPGSSVSPQKFSSQKSSVSLEHVNAKADHLAEKLEELLFNMSVQQREFSNLSRAASGLFRTLIQTLQAVAHCYSILSGGHDEQVTQRRYMTIERELEGRDVGVFASEACVLIEDAIEAVNLVNMLRAPRAVQTAKQ